MSIRVDGIFYVLDAISDLTLAGLLAECKDRFRICSLSKHRTTEIEKMQEEYAYRIQACKEEIERRAAGRVKVAA